MHVIRKVVAQCTWKWYLNWYVVGGFLWLSDPLLLHPFSNTFLGLSCITVTNECYQIGFFEGGFSLVTLASLFFLHSWHFYHNHATNEPFSRGRCVRWKKPHQKCWIIGGDTNFVLLPASKLPVSNLPLMIHSSTNHRSCHVCSRPSLGCWHRCAQAYATAGK